MLVRLCHTSGTGASLLVVQKVIFHAVGEQVRKYRTNWRLQIVISFFSQRILVVLRDRLVGLPEAGRYPLE